MDAEERFRAAEQVLDELLLQDRPALTGLMIHDQCGRTYNYKNPFLTWCYYFIRNVQDGTETRRVSVYVTFMEPPDLEKEDLISIETRAEVFQVGKPSRIDKRLESETTLENFRRTGLAAVLKAAFQTGDALFHS